MKKFAYYSLKLVKLYCTPHIIAKKESKSDMGLPMGMHKCAKGHLTNFGLLMASSDRRYVLILDNEWLFFMDIIATRPIDIMYGIDNIDNILAKKAETGSRGRP